MLRLGKPHAASVHATLKSYRKPQLLCYKDGAIPPFPVQGHWVQGRLHI